MYPPGFAVYITLDSSIHLPTMLTPWSFAPSHDIQEMQKRVSSMRDVLSEIDSSTQRVAPLELLAYCRSLVAGQRSSLGRTKSGSWAISPDDENMPTYARVDFIFAPTYIASSILCRVLLDYPWIPIQIAGYRRALKRGLDFCAYRNLTGSGYGAVEEMLESFVILAIGKVPLVLEGDATLSPALTNVIRDLEYHLRQSVLGGQVTGTWGENLTSGYQAALETLYLYQDKELLDSIRESRELPTSSFGKELPW